jgi:hypothetical protein
MSGAAEAAPFQNAPTYSNIQRVNALTLRCTNYIL